MARPLYAIARDIRKEWGSKVNYAAAPYLAAMGSLGSIHESYGDDPARMIVAYFLGNAASFKGEAAKALKAELKAMIK